MSRKHFQLLADEIKLIIDMHTRRICASSVADACKKANPGFDRHRFYQACGVVE